MKLPKTIESYRKRLVSRRQALRIGIGVVTTLAILSIYNLKVLSYLIYTLTDRSRIKNSDQKTFTVVGKSSLKARAQAKGLIYGAFPQADRQNFDKNLKFKSSFLRECDLVVAGFYWSQVRPTVNTFDFSGTDYFAKFASTNKLLLRGHPLVWHLGLPDWLKHTLNHQNAENILTYHIETVMKRYAGKMHSWDVVNEAIELGDRRPDGFRNTPWLKFLGQDYVELAFRLAAKSDPKALLVYNEWGLESNEAHQEAVLKLLRNLQSKGTPLHALGIQSHIEVGRKKFNPSQFRKFLKEVANLGLKIIITELDIIDTNLPIEAEKRDRIIATAYNEYLNAALAEKAIIAVINWGLSDQYTWLNEFFPRKDRSPSRSLPLDRDMKPKLAWNAIAGAFDRAPKR